jgi:membrane protein YdbS with pleckstrin-like domain
MSRTTARTKEQPASVPGDEWIVRRPGPRERRWFQLHGLFRGLFWLIPFVIIALLWIFWFEVNFTDPLPVTFLALGLLILLGYLIWGVVFPRNWMVAIGARDVMVDRGILWVTRVRVSFDRVQQIDNTSTPIMSRFDLTELVLHSAAGAVRIYALDPDDADLISDRVRESQPHVSPLPQ